MILKQGAFSMRACFVLLVLLLIGCSNPDGQQPAGRSTLVPSLATSAAASVSLNPATATVLPAATSTIAETIENQVFDPPPLTREPERIGLAPGAVSETVEGTIEPPDRDSYLFQAQAGQEITIKLSSPNGLANFELSGLKDGQPYKRLVNEDRHWTGVAPLTQEYLLEVATAQELSPYLLTVTIITMEEPSGAEAPLMFSPDGQWQALATISDPQPVSEEEIALFPTGQKYHVMLVISRVDGDLSWTAVDEWRSWGLGYTFPDVLKWPAGGQDLYFTNVPIPDGCARFVNGGDLWRLNLSNGEISQLLPFVGLVLALSPDDSQLAYFGSYGKGMTLADLATGNEQPIELPSFGDAWDLGGLLWSPDGRYLLTTQVISLVNPCGEETETAVSVVSIDTLEVTTLVEPAQGDFSPVEWLTDDTVRLAGQDGLYWQLNIHTGELAPDTTGVSPQG